MSVQIRQKPSDTDVAFMRVIEDEFRTTSGLKDRSEYKIFYTPIWPAKIMVLGINPGGDPRNIAPDGVHSTDGSGHLNASSASYYEGGENDILDCNWRDNTGLRELLIPIVGSLNDIRRNVVKTNVSFARSRDTKDKKFIRESKEKSAPFLDKLISRVSPELIILTGSLLSYFQTTYSVEFTPIVERKFESKVKQTIIWPARVKLRNDHPCFAIEVAPSGQFGWIYDRYSVGSQIKSLLL